MIDKFKTPEDIRQILFQHEFIGNNIATYLGLDECDAEWTLSEYTLSNDHKSIIVTKINRTNESKVEVNISFDELFYFMKTFGDFV